jgi:hypothetical protein
MRRLALAIAAAVALAGVAGGADARPRKKALRGHASVKRAGLPGAIAAGGLPGAGSPVAPAPSITPAPAPAADPAPPPPPPPAIPTGTGLSLQALTDDRVASQLKLVLSRTTVLAGDVKVEFNNAFAEDPHDLLVERADGTGPAYAFDELGPGEVQRRTLALDAGAWRLSCTIPTHAERGMTAELTVSG